MKCIYENQIFNSDLGLMVKQYKQDYFTSPLHYHSLYELTLIVTSYGKVYTGDKVESFEPGDVFLFGPGLGHCFYNEKSFIATGKIAHAIVVFFKEDIFGEKFFEIPDLIKLKKLLEKSKRGLKIFNLNNSIISEFHRIPKEKGVGLLTTFLHLLDVLSSQKSNVSFITLNSIQQNGNTHDDARLEPVFEYAFKNFKDNLSSKTAASLACLSDASFCRYFKKQTEQTFSEFVNGIRISHAVHLLAFKETSISDICYECGYQNVSYFNRQFKKIKGETPFTYRKMLLNPQENLVTQKEYEFGFD